jgi:hypothetical protein
MYYEQDAGPGPEWVNTIVSEIDAVAALAWTSGGVVQRPPHFY